MVATASVILACFSVRKVRTCSSVHAGVMTFSLISASDKAAASRSRRVRRRAFFPSLVERASRSRMSISSTSSESSWAVTDSWRVKDTSVAVRRCSVNLAILWALVVTAYCARALIRLAGTFTRSRGPTSSWRTSVRRASACTKTGALAREGARRRRSRFVILDAPARASSPSRSVRCSGETAALNRCHKRSATRSRMVETRRVSVVTPGNSTFLSSNQAEALVKEHTGSLGADPDTRIEKTHQGKTSTALRKLFVARVLPDFLSMLLLGLDSLGILRDALWIGNPQLGSDIGNDPHGDIHRIWEKGAQEPECPDLDSKAQTILVATALGNEGAIRIIQMKIAGKLLWGRFANIAAIPLLLFLGQVINRHTAFLVFLSIKQSFSF